MFNFVVSLADAGDDKATAFLNKLLGGGFDWPQDEPAKRRSEDDAKGGKGKLTMDNEPMTPDEALRRGK